MYSPPISCAPILTFLQLPDTIQDFVRKAGKGASDQLLAHCRRELFHASWKLILDDEFVQAYKHGIVLDCADGIRRHIYPRIFTYSADYPEKYRCLPAIVFVMLIRMPGSLSQPCAIWENARARIAKLRKKTFPISAPTRTLRFEWNKFAAMTQTVGKR